ncbi:MAG: Rid family detoxifying hydrolase [Acidimicrobiia bacterium]
MPKTILTPAAAPAPVGPYSIATEANGFVFLSGQVGVDPASGIVVDGGVAGQTRRILLNIEAILSGLGLSFDDVVKTTIFLTDIGDFGAVNEVYGEFVAESKPARSTVGVAALPLGVAVEIEMIAAR